MLKRIGFIFFLIITLLALYALYRLELSQPSGDVSVNSAGGNSLTCSTIAFRDEYQSNMLDISDMTIASQPYKGTSNQQKKAISNYLSTRPNNSKTTIASVHVPTGEIYTHTCKNQKCTIREVFESDRACLLAHMGNCSFIAVRFREQDMCLLQPAQE